MNQTISPIVIVAEELLKNNEVINQLPYGMKNEVEIGLVMEICLN